MRKGTLTLHGAKLDDLENIKSAYGAKSKGFKPFTDDGCDTADATN